MTTREPDGIVWRKSSYSAANGGCVEVGWRKSSFSGGNGECVEVGWHKSSHSNGADACVEVGWRKSSHSNGANACVEVAAGQPGVAVRDSKFPAGPTLAFSHSPWQVFVTRVGGV